MRPRQSSLGICPRPVASPGCRWCRFNEAEAIKPRNLRLMPGAYYNDNASMRPRQSSLGIMGVVVSFVGYAVVKLQ